MSKKQQADLNRLAELVAALDAAQGHFNGLAPSLRREQGVLSYLLAEAREKANRAYDTEHVALHESLPGDRS